MISRRAFIATVTGLIVAPLAAEGQETGKISRIGFLRVGPPPVMWINAFRQGLRDLGYVEGQNLVIKYGLAQTEAQLPDVAAELVRLKVDVIVASGVPSVPPAQSATRTTPVVFVAALDPVAGDVVTARAPSRSSG